MIYLSLQPPPSATWNTEKGQGFWNEATTFSELQKFSPISPLS